ncbi:MAG: nucleotidyl transferase AbiEii/AbiGii toxin family protein [Candidatus Margulisiibacteriota bacterium]
MLNIENLKEFIKKYQTNPRNIVREYVQSLFLSNLYKIDGAEKLLFKGGTALRLVYLSPRFSEDIDFTGQGIYHHAEIDDLFIEALSQVAQAGINIYFKEAKPTTGGYLGLIHYDLYGQAEDMKFEISLRKGALLRGELVTIASEFVPPYAIMQIPPKTLVSGKMAALLSRRKPRDYYDLYFMLRHPQLSKFVDKKKLEIVAGNLESERIDFKRELMVLLPVSHQMILKDFKKTLKKEIDRYL